MLLATSLQSRPCSPASLAPHERSRSRGRSVWPRMESNHRTQIRSLPLYPLSYGAGSVRVALDGRRIRSAALAGNVASVVAGQGRRRDRGPLRARCSLPVTALPGAPRASRVRRVGVLRAGRGRGVVRRANRLRRPRDVRNWGVVSFRGSDETIAGVAVIRFDGDGLVIDQRDYWNAEAGRREPPEGWG